MRTISQALEWLQSQVGHDAPGGPGHCQELARTAYGLPAWATSARLAWEHTPADKRHTGPIKNAPAGAFVYFPTLSDYGHVIVSDGTGHAFSNDYCARGKVCHVPVDIPNWHGSLHYGGWSFWTPHGEVHS